MIRRIINFYKRTFLNAEDYARTIGVKIGVNCDIATKYFGSEPYLIEIGDHVQITSDVRFANHGAAWVLRKKFKDCDFFGKIKVGNNVYIGNCSIILAGVTIGDDVIIGAGSVVTKSIANGSVVGGNPAKLICSVNDFERKILRYNLNTKKFNPTEKKNFLLNLSEDKFLIKNF